MLRTPQGGGLAPGQSWLTFLSSKNIRPCEYVFAGSSAYSPLSSHIFVANKETEARTASLRGREEGISCLLQTFFDDKSVAKFRVDRVTKSFLGQLRFFAGGMLEGRKGVALALRAFSKIHAAGVKFEYVFGGDGPERKTTELRRTLKPLKMHTPPPPQEHCSKQGDLLQVWLEFPDHCNTQHAAEQSWVLLNVV
jgi:hypothetical protein